MLAVLSDNTTSRLRSLSELSPILMGYIAVVVSQWFVIRLEAQKAGWR